MTETQRIYLPFQLADGRELKEPFPWLGQVGGYIAELKENEPYYTIELSGIPTEQEAIVQFKKLAVALYWMALSTQAGVSLKPQLQKIYMPPDPVVAAKNIFGQESNRRADVVIDGGYPAIWPDDKQAVKETVLPVKAMLSYSPSNIFGVLNEGMKLPNPDAILENSRLKLAVDLYCLSHFRSSHFARFLVLWVALETAAPAVSISDSGVGLVDKWIAEARNAQSSVRGDEFEELASILGSLNYIKKQSHGIRVRQYVKSMLEFVRDPDADASAREVRRLYSVRGDLSHTGRYNELGEGLSSLDTIVTKTLKAEMQYAAAVGT